MIPRELVPTFLENCRRGFEAGDAWRAWEALDMAMTHQLTIPEWIISYLAETGKDMARLSLKVEPQARNAAAIARALRLKVKGRGTLVARRHQTEKVAALATDVGLFIAAGHTEYLAIEYVAKFHGLGRTAVREAYKMARARGDRLDGRQVMVLTHDVVQEQGYHAGSRIDGVSYPGEPRRTWVIESLATHDGMIRARLRLEPPPG